MSAVRIISYIVGTIIIVTLFIFGLNWASGFLDNELWWAFLPTLFVIAMSHEFMHAFTWWMLGYFAIPIPILIPPILGITYGEKPNTRWEDAIISLSPLSLTVGAVIVYQFTRNDFLLAMGGLNAFGMMYDVYSIFTFKKEEYVNQEPIEMREQVKEYYEPVPEEQEETKKPFKVKIE